MICVWPELQVAGAGFSRRRRACGARVWLDLGKADLVKRDPLLSVCVALKRCASAWAYFSYYCPRVLCLPLLLQANRLRSFVNYLNLEAAVKEGQEAIAAEARHPKPNAELYDFSRNWRSVHSTFVHFQVCPRPKQGWRNRQCRGAGR